LRKGIHQARIELVSKRQAIEARVPGSEAADVEQTATIGVRRAKAAGATRRTAVSSAPVPEWKSR
jgi:hypothetical protein